MRILVPLAAGFEEIEAVTVIDVLRRAGIEVVVAGLVPGACPGSRGIVLVPDVTLDSVLDSDFDAVVLPGGGPGTKALRTDPRVIELVRRQDSKKRWIAAICAAPTVLADAGVLAGRKATSHPAVRDELRSRGIDLRERERVCVVDHVITSQGPGTAMEFAYAIVERLLGSAKVDELERGILSKSAAD